MRQKPITRKRRGLSNNREDDRERAECVVPLLSWACACGSGIGQEEDGIIKSCNHTKRVMLRARDSWNGDTENDREWKMSIKQRIMMEMKRNAL
ncbi:hypothetical protein IAS59_005616 [Cryptococcus gattii]